MYDIKKIGEHIVALRKRKNMSQETLAEKLFVSRQAVSKWERGEALPDTENLIALSDLFSVSLDELIKGVSLDEKAIQPQEEIAPTTCREMQENMQDIIEEAHSEIQNILEEAHSEIKESTNAHIKINYDRAWFLKTIPYPIIVTIAFLLWGFFGGWNVAWTLYITIPVYYSMIQCIQTRKLAKFSYSVFLAFLFCLFGTIFQIWHPLWVIFLTIPVYYPIAEGIDRHRRK